MSVEAISLDDEEMRVRALQGVPGAIPFVPLSPVTPVGHSAISSIEAAEAPAVPKHRPNLASPRHVMLDVIGCHLETERLAGKGTKLFNTEMTKHLSDMDRLNAEKQEALEQEAKAAKARDTWGVLATVSQYVAGASSIALGLTTFSLAPVAGALLIASGGLGLAGKLARDTHVAESVAAWWTKSGEMQAQITHNIDTGLFYLQMGTGLAGGAWAWQAGAFAASAAAATAEGVIRKASTALTTASTVMTSGAKVGMAFYNKKVADKHADIKQLNGRITTSEQTMYQDSTQMTRIVEAAQAETEELRKAIQALQVSLD